MDSRPPQAAIGRFGPHPGCPVHLYALIRSRRPSGCCAQRLELHVGEQIAFVSVGPIWRLPPLAGGPPSCLSPPKRPASVRTPVGCLLPMGSGRYGVCLYQPACWRSPAV
jgi:hypothetical protein